MVTVNPQQIADTSGVQLVAAREDIWNEPKATNLAQILRLNSETLNLNQTYVTSDEIRPDYQTPDLTRTLRMGGGDLSFELSYRTFDWFLESLLASTFLDIDDVTTNEDVEVSSATDPMTGVVTYTFTITETSNTEAVMQAARFLKGHVVQVTSSETSFHIRVIGATVAQDSSDIVLTAIAAKGDVMTGTLTSVEFSNVSERLVIGLEPQSFTIEKFFPDVNSLMRITGAYVNTMALNITAEQLITGTFGFMGSGGVVVDPGSIGYEVMDGDTKEKILNMLTALNETRTAATTSSIMNAADDVGQITLAVQGSETNIGSVKSLSINANNNMRNQSVVGQVDLEGIGRGRLEVTGTIEAYFKRWDLYREYLDDNYLSFSAVIQGNEGEYTFTMPRMKISNASVTATGVNQDVMVSGDFTATGVGRTAADTMLEILRSPYGTTRE